MAGDRARNVNEGDTSDVTTCQVDRPFWCTRAFVVHLGTAPELPGAGVSRAAYGIAATGSVVVASSPDEMAQALREDSRKWGDVIRDTGTTINQ